MKHIALILIFSSFLISGCGQKQKKAEDAKQISEWSCTHPENLQQIESTLKNDYLKKIDKKILQENAYTADQDILNKINRGLSFKINQVRTLTADTSKTNKLECEGQIVVQFPKGLQQRAENAFTERNDCYEDCYERENPINLRDYIEEQAANLVLENDQLKGKFNFQIIKTDKDGYSLNVNNQENVISSVSEIALHAVLYKAYVNENKMLKERDSIDKKQDVVQKELAQKVMDIRQKELDLDKKKQVELLNQTWDLFSNEQKEQLKQEQKDWFEKRDVDCQVLAQRYNIYRDDDTEVYQKQSNYWDNAMIEQSQQMQYTKCFNSRTQDRIESLKKQLN
ncbi:DUF1311 domain-containing protein [Acinetobacter gerneri]|uniref:DUF1311 domain-containing protein n=1 Tax=Acinetobacter gerneri TaxID=202952 RepID=UPI0028A878FD|nr:DUF1311 domain-containing protein [Acinetobacter gerneri]